MKAKVVGIHIALKAEGPMAAVQRVRAVAGRGLEGDRYFDGEGTFSKNPKGDREVTLVEIEAIEALRDGGIDIAPGEARRNLVTRGVALNHLVGVTFEVGQVRLKGIRLCEPCSHLEGLTKPGVREGLIHRGGLRAAILNDGEISAGDAIEVLNPQ